MPDGYISQVQLPNNTTYELKVKSNNITPAIHKTWVDASYYGSSSSDVHDNSTFFLMSIKPDSWYKPWTVRFKITTTCPAAANYYSVTYSTYSGRADSYIVSNWVERYDHAHYYTNIRTLKKAGFDAGLGHALGINLYASNNYANSNYYRKFDLEYYDCDGCTVTILENPVKWANWTNNSSTYYNGNSNSNAVDRGLQESGDNNTITRLYMGNNYFINGSTLRLPGYTIFGLDSNNHTQTISLYHSTYDGNTTSINTARVYNTAGFAWQKGLYYNTGGNYAVNANVNISIDIGTHAIDFRYTDNCVAASSTTTLGLVARKPVYLRGIIDTDGLFYLRPIDVTYNSTTYKRAWTQDEPTEVDNFIYWFLGYPYYNGTYPSGYQLNFYPDNKLFWYHNGSFQEYVPHAIDSDTVNGLTVQTAVPANAVFTDHYAWGDITSKPDTATRWPKWNEISQSGAENLNEGSSNVTDNTEILTSYASNNGFADTNGKGVVYRRDAIKVYNYIKGKLDSVYATQSTVNGLLAAADAMVFKGVINATNALPNSHNAGDTYRVGTAGTYPIVDSNGKYCEVGTLIICIADGTAATPAHWTAVETNEDGAVIGPTSSTDNAIVRFDGTTGRIIQNSGVTIDDSNNLTVPGTALKITNTSGAKFILMGNQDSSGANKPTILEAANGTLYIGNGTDWSANNGGTLSTALYMAADRKIGIGTTSPSELLHIVGNLLLGNSGSKAIYYQGTKSKNAMITFLDNTSDTYGNGIKIGGGGTVVVGAGESAANLSVTAGNEILYLTSDGAINIEAGGDTIANRVGIQVTAAGHIIPVKTEAANNNKQNLGASDNRWATIYSTKFNGVLTPSSWLDGQRYQNGAFNIADYSNTGSYNPWMRATNTWSSGAETAKVGRWFSFGTLGASFYWMGSTTTRTENSYDHALRYDVSSGKLYCDGTEVSLAGHTHNYKPTQTAVDSGAAATNKWVSRIEQNTNGVITATMGTLDTSGAWSGNATTATTASGANALVNQSISTTNLDKTAGSFAFSIAATTAITQITSSSTDYVGIQLGDNADKWQLTATGNNLFFRQNDNGGTNATWNNWTKLLSSSNYKSYAWAVPSSITDNQVILSSGTDGSTTLRGILNNTSIGALGWNSAGSSNADNIRFITANTLAYWDGRYYTTNNASNLEYYKGGKFGTMAKETAADYAKLASPALTGTPTAPTAANGTNTTQIATTAFVNNTLTYAKAMTFKGTLGTNGTVTALPASHNAGDTYRVITAGTWAGKTCVAGDLIICVNTGTTAADADWTSVETNEDGAVIGPAEADSTTDNAIVRWDSTTGRVIQNSGITIDDNNNISNVNQINISNTTAAVHLGFARTGGHNSPNYINVPASSSLAISVGGASGTNIIAMIDPEGIVPFTTNTKSIGTSTYKWSAVYATTYYGALETKTTGTSAARPVWFSYYASSAVQDGVLEKDTDFTYNPSTNVLVVGKLTITGGTTNSTIASSGTLDIANAAKALTVSTTTAALTISTSNGALEAKSTGTGTVKLTSNSGAMTLSTTSGNMSLSSGGTVSISSGSSKSLAISAGSTASISATTTMTISSTTSTSISATTTMSISGTQGTTINSGNGYATVFKINNTEYGRFNTNGMFQLNDTGTQNTHKLYVNGDSAFNGKIAFGTQSSNTITNKAYMVWNNTDLSIDFIFV